jgi:hypothetical protein
VREFLKRVRDSGVTVGLSVHNPKLVDLVESENWDVDFYMTTAGRRSVFTGGRATNV